ncbi:hypothetical protein RhiirC2_800946 [Rhizophagus irregularis]|uniref:Uncharacterized protein n=1 Tax=Rhizophagus irregularis TaxID=588596 RepID=A0A2N1M2Z1_9GLOM|nr:hypothetical protein RhiirC2_800946 [Rhizophagus irregularis]
MCLQNLIFQDNALITYQKFQNLNNNQKDMFLFGIITATARNETTTKGQKRFKLSSEYIFEGIKICNLAFLIIYGIGEKYWRNIRNHFMQHGISPRIHKAIGKVSNFALSFEKVLEVISFITNYGNIYGLPSPGRHFREDTLPITFLPASESYSSLYRLYKSAIEDDENQRIIHLATFWRIWQKYIPEFKFLSPRSDLCSKCKEMRFNSKYWSEQESESRVAEWNYYFQWTGKEREFYRNCIQLSKTFIRQIPNYPNLLRPNEPNTLDFENHISWDYAEQIKIPYSSQQEVCFNY